MSNTFVIGDIHGALKALQQLLQKISPAANDRFIFLGDFVDGWSQSAQVIQYVIEFSKKYECIFIKGNHDEDCRLWLESGEVLDAWLAHGGGFTLESYAAINNEERQKHLEFFKNLRDYYVDDKNRLFVHAGFSNRRGPQYEHYNSNFTWDRTLLETAVALDPNMKKDSPFYPKRLLIFNEIYIGHTPTTGYNIDVPLQAANLWNVDTGAAFLGKLSAINVETKEIFQTDAVKDLYPNETGRNQLS